MDSPPISTYKRHLASCGQMDALPVEVIGNILSHVADAQLVAVASATCRKWRDAAKHHLYRLSFDVSRWGKKIDSMSRNSEEEEESDEGRTLDECEATITEAVMRTTCLQELSICHANKKRRSVTFGTASVLAWLLHTKRTLTHLTLAAHIKSKLSILEKLAAGGEGVLKCLVWHSACIPKLDPSIHSLPCLVSLTLNCVVGALRMRDLHLLLTIFPKLESLTLIHIWSIYDAPSVVELNIPPLLRALKLKRVFFGCRSVDLLLHARNLESLSLCDLMLQKLDLGDTENLQHLEISKCKFEQLEVGNLPSLLHAKLIGVAYETRMLPLFLEIISKVGTKLSKLHLLVEEDADTSDVIDVDMIASSFPALRCLCLDYEHAFIGSSQHKLEQVSVLGLHKSMNETNDKLFAQWIVGLLKCCPNAKQLTIVLGTPTPRNTATKQQFVSRLASLLIGLMRPYPHVDVKFEM